MRNTKKPIRRRDGAGHLDPRYAAELRELAKETAGPKGSESAFVAKPRSGRDELAEQFGETFVRQATSGEDCSEDVADEVVTEESGGPFVVSRADKEFGYEVDESNPADASREPFPKG